jgi:hypothetical protein
MAVKSLQATVAAWQAGTGTGQQRYLDGVAQTTVDPTQRAIAAKQALLQNFQNSVNSGLWERRLAAVGEAGWKAAVAAKGGANWATGIAAAGPKYSNRMSLVLQVENGLQQQIDSMPSGTPAANDARMLAWSNGMRQAKANGAFG